VTSVIGYIAAKAITLVSWQLFKGTLAPVAYLKHVIFAAS